MLRQPQTTAQQFDTFVMRPENADRIFELIRGEIVEVLSNARVSEIAMQIVFSIKLFLHENNLRGHVTGEAGGYQIAGDRYAPDVAYMSVDKQAELDDAGYNTVPPDLSVEVLSSDNPQERNALRIKLANYAAVGVHVWVVDPDVQTVEVYLPGKPVTVYHANDTVDGSHVIPDFQIRVADIFAF